MRRAGRSIGGAKTARQDNMMEQSGGGSRCGPFARKARPPRVPALKKPGKTRQEDAVAAIMQ
jgi:hypothetical protein